jgi:hypothetical protein
MAVKRLAKSLCVLTLLCGSVFAQTTMATLQGIVTDPGGAVVPGVVVQAKDVATGGIRSTTTGVDGFFRFDSMLPAVYNLTIRGTVGFKTFELNNINLTASETRELGRLKLELGAVTEQIEVTAPSIAVQTTSSDNSKLVDTTQMEGVAVRGRDMFAMLQTIPGVDLGAAYLTQGGISNVPAETSGPGAPQVLQINGNPLGRTNFTVDGVTDLDTAQNYSIAFEPTVDSIAEIRVMTTNYQAEYGRDLAQIQVVTKSGSQQFHGGASANKRHEMLNAKNFFTNYNGQVKPEYRFFIWNYQIGGPVYIPRLFNTQKKKLFFFFSQEYTRQSPGPSSGYANVPSANERNGDFSYYTNSNGAIVSNSLRNPVTGAYFTPSASNPSLANFAQYAGNFDAASEAIGQDMLSFYPQPNLCNAAAGTSDGKPWNGIAAGAGGSNLISPTNCPSSVVAANPYLATGNIDAQGGPGTSNNQTRNYYWQFQGTHPRRNDTARMDYNVTSKLTTFFRWSHDFDVAENGATLPQRNSTGTFEPVQDLHPNPGHGFAVGATYAISPTLVNEFLFGYTNTSWDEYPADQSQLNRSNMGNPPSFDNFATDPNFINDVNQARPDLSTPGSLNYQVGIPTIAFGGGQLTETGTSNTSLCGQTCPSTNGNNIYTFHDSVSKVIGKHNLKAGLYYERTEFWGPAGSFQTYLGGYSFAGGNVLNPHDTGDGWANAYLGQINQYTEYNKTIGDWSAVSENPSKQGSA